MEGWLDFPAETIARQIENEAILLWDKALKKC
jgi:hypothetical protein